MPNTLAHLGIQSLVSRGLFPGIALAWIFLGCILPDVPWIVRRVLLALLPAGDHPRLGTYFAIQASLLFSLLLAWSVSRFGRRPGRLLAVLSLGVVLHLLLDACQEKWGSGVLLLAPFDWRLFHLDLFPIESWSTVLLTLGGLGYGLATLPDWLRRPPQPVADLRRTASAAAGLALYLLLPLLFWASAWEADLLQVRTFLDRPNRTGREVAVDRGKLAAGEGKVFLELESGEKIALEGVPPDRGGRASLRGRFVSGDRIRVVEYRLHPPAARDLGSYAGLLLIAAAWAVPVWRRGSRSG